VQVNFTSAVAIFISPAVISHFPFPFGRFVFYRNKDCKLVIYEEEVITFLEPLFYYLKLNIHSFLKDFTIFNMFRYMSSD